MHEVACFVETQIFLILFFVNLLCKCTHCGKTPAAGFWDLLSVWQVM